MLRHLQGYELGLVTLAMVLTFAALVLPRGSEPCTLPLPRVDRTELRRSEARERARAERAQSLGLPFEVRAVGEAVRHFGQRAAAGADTSHDMQDLRERVRAALERAGSERLLELRAVQTQLFLRALADFERDHEPNAELSELGGAFLQHARQNGWIDAAGHCVADESTRAVLFRIYWTEIVEQRVAFPYAPSLDEWRAYYGFLLRYPEHDPARLDSADRVRLRVVRALSRKDPEYPALMAEGYLLYSLGDPRAAATAFRSQLARHESGPYALLARNYLIQTLREASSE